MPEVERYRPIGEYAFISDCHCAALVSRDGSVDWCCMPRFDSGSVFGRLLDADRGGFCSISSDGAETFRRYLGDSLVLETTFKGPSGQARLLDCMTMRAGGAREPYRQLLRVVEGVRGWLRFELRIAPRLDYGEVEPWLHRRGVGSYTAMGGNDGLLISGDVDLDRYGEHQLAASFTSAIVLKGLQNARTGAIVAAPTTSLPETPGGERNWDYRYSWVRDSAFTVRSLAALGREAEPDAFRRFVERSAAGGTASLQIVYGVGGERHLTERTLDGLDGYRGARPVRVGNAAAGQVQLDVYGELLALAWRWHRRGSSPDDDYWRFLVELIDAAAERWQEPDQGIWEPRSKPRHFVHSKVMGWAALDRGLKLADECLRRAPTRRWTKVRDEIRTAVEQDGYDKERGVFVQSFGSKELDAALLRLPSVDFVAWDDPRMVRTTDAIRQELGDSSGLILRYRNDDGLRGREGAFVPCSFWLVECLAHQGRLQQARKLFDRVCACGNDVGLFSEEYDG